MGFPFRLPFCLAWRPGPRRLTLGAMCGRFALSMTSADLAKVFDTHNAVPNFQPNWNLPPSQPAPVVRHNPKTGERSLDVLRRRPRPRHTAVPPHSGLRLKSRGPAANARIGVARNPHCAPVRRHAAVAAV